MRHRCRQLAVLAALLALVLTPLGASAQAFVATHRSSPLLGVNLRTEPSLQARIVTVLTPATPLAFLNETAAGDDGATWLRMQTEDGQIGWLPARTVKPLMSALGTDVSTKDDASEFTIALNEYQGSGVSGWATLTPTKDGLQVTMAVEGKPVKGNHPSHIHTGTCKDFDPNPTFPLTTVVLDPLTDDGESKTAVDEATLDELLEEDFVILIHKSAEELTEYFVCGDIKESNAYTGPRTAGSMTVPSTGTGSVEGERPAGAWLVMSTAALVVVLAATGFALRRRSLVSD